MTKFLQFFLIFLSLPSIGYNQHQIEKLFYFVDQESSFDSFKSNIDQITIVAPQSYKMDAAGNISGSVDNRLLNLAKQNEVSVIPLIVNPGFDQKIIHAVLQDSLARRRAIETMLAICQEHNFLGLQFDFEHIHIADKDAFTQFFQQAAKVLHAKGFIISTAVFPRTADYVDHPPYHRWYFENWTGAFDYKALAQASDFLTIMTYDQHSHKTPPGPVAGIPWLEKVLKYILEQVPANKISLGIPLYSYYWFPTADDRGGHIGGRGMAFDKAMDLLRKHETPLLWNHKQMVFYTFFANHSIFEYLFIENVRSFRAKFAIVKKYNLRGFSAWRLGLEDPEIWNVFK
ncbi:MAG: glycosyl hydrolase family 18 protein [bacterium]